MERLDKILAGTGRWSRREVKDLVRQGRVRVDGQTARTAEEKVAPEAAAITVDGQPVETERFTYVMLHKARRGAVRHRGQPPADGAGPAARGAAAAGPVAGRAAG